MSVTTTDNPLTYSALSVLADYELRHTTPLADVTHDLAPPNARPDAPPPSQNPPTWPTDHRRVPPYRPVDETLDQSQRRVFLSRVEQAFISVMFLGVGLNAVREALAPAVGRGMGE